MLGLAACGRRGPLEPPPDSAQGREFARRTGRDKQNQQNAPNAKQPQGSVRESLKQDDDQKGTLDVEADVERNRVEGEARIPLDPTTNDPTQSQPSISPTGSRRKPPGIIPPKRSFILDGLLE